MVSQADLFDRAERPNGPIPAQSECLLGLARVRGLGIASLRKLSERFCRLSDIWSVSRTELAREIDELQLRTPDVARRLFEERDRIWEDGRKELARLSSRGIQLILRDHPLFPPALADLSSPPYWLFVEGNAELLGQQYLVAIVGTRNPTNEGVENARALTSALVERGLAVVSGLAEGIDTVVHETVVEIGGQTIAVLGTGISVVFPAGTAGLRRLIVDTGGSIVTEYFPYDTYNRNHFIQRNRLQAALASIVFPVQCAERSGTAHTIRFAQELGRGVVGVKRGVPANVEQNEVLRVLTASGHVVLDLEKEREQLWALLSKPLSQVPRNRPALPALGRFASLVADFRRLTAKRPITEEEFATLIEALRQARLQKREPDAD
jgi:DNA processing protein